MGIDPLVPKLALEGTRLPLCVAADRRSTTNERVMMLYFA
jgi:hypothetical protein